MIQIVTAANEMNAAHIVEVLRGAGIHASYASDFGRHGHLATCTVYCVEDKKEEALNILRELELISK